MTEPNAINNTVDLGLQAPACKCGELYPIVSIDGSENMCWDCAIKAREPGFQYKITVTGVE